MLKRNEPKKPIIENSADVERIITTKNLPASQRKNLKVSPDSYKAIKIICANKNRKMYEFVDDLVNNYLEKELSDRERRALIATLKE